MKKYQLYSLFAILNGFLWLSTLQDGFYVNKTTGVIVHSRRITPDFGYTFDFLGALNQTNEIIFFTIFSLSALSALYEYLNKR